MRYIIIVTSLIFLLSGCVPKTIKAVGQLAAPKAKPEEVFAEKQVLVYEKTITLPSNISPIRYLQFSPTDPDELAVALSYKGKQDNMHDSDHYAIIDLKKGSVKKDIPLEEYKDRYSAIFNYSEDGTKLYFLSLQERAPYDQCSFAPIGSSKGWSEYLIECKEKQLTLKFRHKFAILDVKTGSLSPYYEYNCDNLIPKEELHSSEKRVYCGQSRESLRDFDETILMNAGYDYFEPSTKTKVAVEKDGIVLYDKQTLKAKEIITLDVSNANVSTNLSAIDLNNRYALFKSFIFGDVESIHYSIYDLHQRKIVAELGNPFFVEKPREYIFLDEHTIVLRHLLRQNGQLDAYVSVYDINTKQKKSFDCSEYRCDVTTFYPLSSRYILWKGYQQQIIYIFDTYDMKVVQQFSYNPYQFPFRAISLKHKKLAFADENKIYIYSIAQE